MDNFFRDKNGRVVVWQTPNLPLWLWIVSLLLGRWLHGTAHTLVSSAGNLALLIWAVLEVARGDSLFRRLLGTVVLTGMTVSLATKLLN